MCRSNSYSLIIKVLNRVIIAPLVLVGGLALLDYKKMNDAIAAKQKHMETLLKIQGRIQRMNNLFNHPGMKM